MSNKQTWRLAIMSVTFLAFTALVYQFGGGQPQGLPQGELDPIPPGAEPLPFVARSSTEQLKFGYNPDLKDASKEKRPNFHKQKLKPKPGIMQLNEASFDANGVHGLWRIREKAGWKDAYPKHVVQTIGDCVGHGTRKAVEDAICRLVYEGKLSSFKRLDTAWIYGGGRHRVLNNQLCCQDSDRCDGSTGWAATKFTEQYGVLLASDIDGRPYSGRDCRKWSCGSGMEAYYPKAKPYTVKWAKCNSWADLVDAISENRSVTVCSNVGFEGGGYKQDGKVVLRRGGSWAHCMTIDGVDTKEPFVGGHIWNHWPEQAHPAPIDDSPIGGFWATREAIEAIIKQGDSWVCVGIEGLDSNEEIEWLIEW